MTEAANVKPPAPMRSRLGRVRGLGTGGGVAHWWGQRVSALALIGLGLWFIISLITLALGNSQSRIAWFHSPISAALMILMLLVTFYHAAAGVQVVVEDYVHREGMKLFCILLVKFVAAGLAITSVIAVVEIAQNPWHLVQTDLSTVMPHMPSLVQ